MKAIKKNNSLGHKKFIKKTPKTKKVKQRGVGYPSDQSSTLKNEDSPRQKDLLKPLKKESPINAKRIAKIKRAIERGQYKANYARTAEKLLQFEDEIWGEKDKT